MATLDHLERHLGSADGFFSHPDPNATFEIAVFKDKPFEGITIYSTVGLNKHRFAQPEPGHSIRQELTFFVTSDFDSSIAAWFIGTLADDMVKDHQGIHIHECIVNSKPIFPGSEMCAVYCSTPMIVSDDFCLFEEEGGSKTMLVWLIPVYKEEADFIQEKGGDLFGDVLEEKDPDLWDINRPPIL